MPIPLINISAVDMSSIKSMVINIIPTANKGMDASMNSCLRISIPLFDTFMP